jgi:hypothetical protein
MDQRWIALRDGIDLRYRVPVTSDPDLVFDFAFGPTLMLALRAERLEVRTQTTSDAGSVWAASLVPGVRFSFDLHLPLAFTVRAGGDVDYLPAIHKNGLSFTRAPSIDQWLDAHLFVAVRWSMLEVSLGWRRFATKASGGRVRDADVSLQGFQATVSLRF